MSEDQKPEIPLNPSVSTSGGESGENIGNSIVGTSNKKPSGFAAVISNSSTNQNQKDDENGGNSTPNDVQLNPNNQSTSSLPGATVATPLDDGPGQLRIDSKGNSPANSSCTTVSTTTIASTSSTNSPSTVLLTVAPTPVAHSHNVRIPPAINSAISNRPSPQPAHTRPNSGTPQFQPLHSQPNIPPTIPPLPMHPPANVHIAPPSNPASVVLPFSTAANIHHQHYGLVATPAFGHGGGQTIIMNQYGQPVGVVSPSPAVGQQGLSLSSYSTSIGAPTAAQLPINNSISTTNATAPPRGQPLTIAYRQPGNIQQQVTSTPHSQTNSPASNASVAGNINVNVAAAHAAMGMIPLFHSHFPYQYNVPVLLPTGQVVCRTPQGQLIGFQVPAMASHHHVAVHHPQQQPASLEQQQQQQHHLAATSATKYPNVLPKLAPAVGGAGFNSQSVTCGQQQQMIAQMPSGPYAAVGQFPLMAAGGGPILHQQLPIAKAAQKVLPMVPIGSGTSTPTNLSMHDASTSGQEIGTPSHLDKTINTVSTDGATSGNISAMDISNSAFRADMKPITKKPKAAASGTPKGKPRPKKSTGSMGPVLGAPMKNLCVIDDDPGPLRVFTSENSEQTANEIHEMFVRALAEQRDDSGPPQILTHLIDGYIIQESMDPFPISPHPFDDFNISAVVMTTDSMSEWSAPPQLSPACARSTNAAECISEPSVCPHCGRVIEGAPYSKAPTYCSRFCFKAFQRMEENSALSPGTKRQISSSSVTQSSGTSAVQSPTVGSPKSSGSPSGNKEKNGNEKDTAASTSSDTSGDGLLRIGSPRTTTNGGAMGKKRPEEWTVDDVCNWVKSFGPGFELHAPTFRQQEIDGQALLLLEEDHLVRGMGMKFGPALKLLAGLKNLRKHH